MNFDFMGAKLKHSTWKLQLRGFLDGKQSLTLEQATSHRDCDLGTWLYSEGLTKYGSIPDMKSLESEHEALHRTVKSVIELKDRGMKAQAEAEYAKIDAISKHIVALLTSVEAQVVKKPA